MKDGFIKAAAGTPDVRVADCEFNATEIIRMVHEMEEQGAKVMVFPELCITAYTCGDLFWQENLLEEAKVQLVRIAEETADVDALIFVGLPLEYKGKLYNVAAGLNHAKFLDLCRRSICLITMSFMKQDILLQEKTLTEPCILIGMCTELVMNQIQNPMMWNLRLRWLN